MFRGHRARVFSMFLEAPDAPVCRLLVVLFVPTQQMFSGSLVHAVLYTEDCRNCSLSLLFL